MPVVVGVILAVIILISFTGWFTQMFVGWQEYIVDDTFFGYRIAIATIFSIVIISATFLGMAYAYECPGEKLTEQKTILSGLKCEAYLKIRTGAEELFKKEVETVTPGSTTRGMEGFIED